MWKSVALTLCLSSHVAVATTGCENTAYSSTWLSGTQLRANGILNSYDATLGPAPAPAPPPFLVSSSNYRGYSYDNAIAVIAWLLSDDQDVATAHGVLAEMASDLHQFAASGSEPAKAAAPFYWNGWSTNTYKNGMSGFKTGNHAWVTYAFAMYELVTGNTDFSDTLDKLAYFLLDQSLIQADSKYCFRGSTTATWCAAEHNIDAYFALHLASHVAGIRSDTTQQTAFMDGAKIAAEALLTDANAAGANGGLWNNYRFNQGYTDDSHALDANTWGALFLLGMDRDETWMASLLTTLGLDDADLDNRARSALDHASTKFDSTQTVSSVTATGYNPYYYSPGGAVWSEGSYGAAIASARLSAETSETTTMPTGANIILGIDPLVDDTTGSVLYAYDETDVGQGEHFYDTANTAATAWRLLACSSVDDIFVAKAATYTALAGSISYTP